MAVINSLVEGDLDHAVADTLIQRTGHVIGAVYGKKGIGYIKTKVRDFNKICDATCFLTLVDFMDTHLPCPAEVISQWLPHRYPNMLFRVAVREIESWLMADRSGLANFLAIDVTKVPANPEEIEDPKRSIINLARRSKKPSMRSALVPESGSTAQVGRLYTSEMTRYIKTQWNITAARGIAPSLEQCLRRLEALG
jgi:hypothetical protein